MTLLVADMFFNANIYCVEKRCGLHYSVGASFYEVVKDYLLLSNRISIFKPDRAVKYSALEERRLNFIKTDTHHVLLHAAHDSHTFSIVYVLTALCATRPVYYNRAHIRALFTEFKKAGKTAGKETFVREFIHLPAEARYLLNFFGYLTVRCGAPAGDSLWTHHWHNIETKIDIVILALMSAGLVSESRFLPDPSGPSPRRC